jgi:dipeptidyl-peptidase-4
MSNSLQLAYALQKGGKAFELMIYPRNRHGIVDPQQRRHMYQMMTDFLERNLKQ